MTTQPEEPQRAASRRTLLAAALESLRAETAGLALVVWGLPSGIRKHSRTWRYPWSLVVENVLPATLDYDEAASYLPGPRSMLPVTWAARVTAIHEDLDRAISEALLDIWSIGAPDVRHALRSVRDASRAVRDLMVARE